MTTEKAKDALTTLIYVLVALIPILVSLIWYMSGYLDGIKADVTATRVEVKDARTEAKEQNTALSVAFHKTIDSVQNLNNIKFTSIDDKLGLAEDQRARIANTRAYSAPKYYTQRFTVDSAGNRVYKMVPHN
jgi:hypothetical protein